MNAHSAICGDKPAEQLDLISPAANGGAQAPTEAEARRFLKNAMRDAMSLFPAENTKEAMLEALSGNDGVMNAALDEMLRRIGPNSPGTMAEAAAGTALVVMPEAEAAEDDDANAVWGIEAQAEIEISRLPGGSVLVHELPGPGTQSEGERIVVTAGNAVAFARRVLLAAGFKGVLIATCGGGGGYCDLEDGDLPERYAPENQKPGYGEQN